MPFLPRIYYLDPQLTGAGPALEEYLARCAHMGFNYILTPSQTDCAAINVLNEACAQRQMQLLLDLDIPRLASDAYLAERHPDWFERGDDEDGLPDPRRALCSSPTRRLRYERQDTLEAIADYWRAQIQALASAGVAGFRCMGLGQTPPMLWKKITHAAKADNGRLCFLAWTPGCTAEQIDALADCGFDATFSSGAWWDFRSRWLAEDHERLGRIAPPIALPDSPDEAVLARVAGNADAAVRQRLYLRALGLAAATGNGILVPMGFEHGWGGERGASGDKLREHAAFDLSADLAHANALMASAGPAYFGSPIRILSSPGGHIAVMLRESLPAADAERTAWLAVANADAHSTCTVPENRIIERAGGYILHERIWPKEATNDTIVYPLTLATADFQLFKARRLAPILLPVDTGSQATVAAAANPRIAIEAVGPCVDAGLFPVKRIIGDAVDIEADVFADGHDKLAVAVHWRAADEGAWHEIRMSLIGNDRWQASLPLTRIGRYLFFIEAWRDVFSTYRDELEKKTGAGLNVSVELEEGHQLVDAALRHAVEQNITPASANLAAMSHALTALQAPDAANEARSTAERIAILLSDAMNSAMQQADARAFAARSTPEMRIEVERPAARFSSWYELFPRSQSGDPARHGTFADVEKRLPAIRSMGFDTLYFPPIHPIGRRHRKGRNNSLTAGPGEPGSPYAIGAGEGGHDAIHPQLGTLDDFRHLRDAAARHGLELALDFAIQCAPDHPWLQEHPEWFAWRPDGTVRYAENPPKKYQDIVNVDFYAEGAIPGLWSALRDVVLFWVEEGVRVFRVDNPHTKTLPFWEWLIAGIRASHPDTIFLSEAFTRPKVMYRLAKIGFSQSYTYFTWRHTKQEFIDYMTELSTTAVQEYFRPHFFVNTPDINPYFLQRSGRPGFLIRAALATMLSGLWGMYSGFELCEAAPIPGKEEYLDSEKYEIRAWDWQRPGNIIREITQLNHIRRENPALQTHLHIRFLPASSEHILFFLKSAPPGGSVHVDSNVVLVAINLDPFSVHEAWLELPFHEFGLPDEGVLGVDDLVGGSRLHWQGNRQHLRLDPNICPYAIWRVRSI
ncbi:maltotransferase domain-containing protein [Janthinobacterium sp. 17J80-10]|uniref:maltotransferase domain-containing protein n=1 Tax=Janthinobacterium sp. 17J80-10 TaxID=2497863 RepID=UPI001F512207|nr:maltotransferase domain-containing protein [Janthinobacterium sp. 17J80-10]